MRQREDGIEDSWILFVTVVLILGQIVTAGSAFSAPQDPQHDCRAESSPKPDPIEALQVNAQAVAQVYLKDFKGSAREFLARLDQKPPLAARDLEKLILELRQAYLSVDRSKISPKDIYENQYTLRFVNARIQRRLEALRKEGRISEGEQAMLLARAQIRTSDSLGAELEPVEKLYYKGMSATPNEFSVWADKPEFYNYRFEGDEVVLRGMRIRSGDLILNNPASRPTGIFTSIAQEDSAFAHVGVVVFLERNGKKLPVVLEEHEHGVRAVPLNHYLSPRIAGYTEVFRLKNEAEVNMSRKRLSSEAHQLLRQEIPYDLSGTPNSNAMSCVEFVNHLYRRSGIEPFPITKGISDKAFSNVLKMGPVDRNFVTPTQVTMNSRLKPVGYLDSGIPLKEMIANEAVVKVFHDQMTQRKMEGSKLRANTGLNEAAIDRVRDPDSLVGDLILSMTGFRRTNFPYGSKEMMASVTYMNSVTEKAMNNCLDENTECSKKLQAAADRSLQNDTFSMNETVRSRQVLEPVAGEMHDWINLFK
jgi:hypothetical protein